MARSRYHDVSDPGHVALLASPVRQDIVDTLVALGGEADVLSLTLGANHRYSENAYWGVGITLGNHDNDVASANLDSRAVIGSIGGALRFELGDIGKRRLPAIEPDLRLLDRTRG